MTRDPSHWREDAVTPAEAVAAVGPGHRVFVGSACATPRTLLAALAQNDRLIGGGVELVHFLTDGGDPPNSAFTHRAWFVGADVRNLAARRRLEYVPMSLADLAGRIHRRLEPIDVALVQVAPPDDQGQCSLGISVDVTLAAARAADVVVAEVLPSMPRVRGGGSVAWESISAHTVVEGPPIEYVHPDIGDVAEHVARYVARLVPDGATLQVGVGRVPNRMLEHLTNRTRLGIHSDVLTEPLVDLIESGAVDGSEKSVDRGISVGSWAMGTERLYRMLDDNPAFELRPADEVCSHDALAGQAHLVSVTQAFAVDLSGQVVVDSHEGTAYGGVSTQPDFHRAAADSPGGRAIVCLQSLLPDGGSAFVVDLLPGQAVGIPRHEVRWLVTEWGAAYLYGLSLRERAVALLSLAHPNHRDALLDRAKAAGLVPAEQTLRSHRAYPDEEVRQLTLRDGRTVVVRPSQESDAPLVQRLFHQLRPQDVYTRFFRQMRSLPTSMAAHLCGSSYEGEMAFVAVTGDAENERCVATSSFFLMPETGLADVAYMVDPEYAGCGLASSLQDLTVDYAKRAGIRGFHADVLSGNASMLAVIRKADAEVTVGHEDDGSVEVEQVFR